MASEGSTGSRHGSNKFLDQTIQSALKFGIDHQLLDTNQIRSRFPQFNLVGDERGYYEPMMLYIFSPSLARATWPIVTVSL